MKRTILVSILVLAILALFGACPDSSNSGSGDDVYTVTFDKNHDDADGFTEANPKTKTVVSPAATVDSLPTAPTRTGYDFVSWNKKADGSGEAFAASTTVTANITVYAQWQAKDAEPMDPDAYTIALNITGEDEGDSVTISPQSGNAGDIITISYTLADIKINNQLVFSGVKTAPSVITTPTTETWDYTIDAEDAINGTITINATFTHSDKLIDTISFESTGHVNKTYGDPTFTRAATTGSGSGTITYSSSDTGVATVTNAGLVTILKAGETTITAKREEDDTHAEVSATYTLNIEKLQLTISGTEVTETKVYDGNTTATVTTIGTLDNNVGDDDVSVSATATFNSANVTEANTITVVYSITGDDVDNYIKPVDSVITSDVSITKAQGAALTGTLTATPTVTTITLAGVSLATNTGQTIEYALSETDSEPSSGWKEEALFEGLTHSTTYYAFARAKASDNYEAGATVSGTFATNAPPPPRLINFEDDAIGKTYGVTKGGAAQTIGVAVIADPVNSGEKSLQVTTSNYNQAAVIPISLKGVASTATSFTFRLLLQTGSLSNQQVQVFISADPSTFDTYNTFPTLNNNKFGQTGNITISANNSWATYTINPSPGSAISGLTGTVYIAIGIHNNSGIVYLLDDLQFIFPKNTGAEINGSVTASNETDDSVTITAALSSTNPGNQTIEYAVSGSNASTPASGWQNSNVITGLDPGTTYYAWARSKENDDYKAGTAVSSESFKTTGESITPQPIVVDFSNAGMFRSIGNTATLNAYDATYYTYTPNNWDVGLAFTVTLPGNLSLADYGTITFTLTAGTGNNAQSKGIRVKGGKPLPNTIGENATNNIHSATTVAQTDGTFPQGSSMNVTVTIENSTANQALTGAIELSVYMRQQNQQWTISNFTLIPR